MSQQYLSRIQASEYLKARGLPVEPTTLQKWATTGGGPNYYRFGNRAVYAPDDLDVWAQAKLGAPRASTSTAA